MRRLTKTKQDNHKTIGVGNENSLTEYGFEKSSFGCCASRQSKVQKTITRVRVRLCLEYELVRVRVRVRVKVGVRV